MCEGCQDDYRKVDFEALNSNLIAYLKKQGAIIVPKESFRETNADSKTGY